MIVIGDISGIQNFLFDVADAGGGQSRRLRARSFFLQALPDIVAIRVLKELGWGFEAVRLAVAGKFVLHGMSPSNAEARLSKLDMALSQSLLSESRGELRLSLGWSDDQGTEADQYRAARERLQQSKARPWAATIIANGRWDVSRLVLQPLDAPCALCRHASSEIDDWDEDTKSAVRVCRQCKNDGDLGRRLPKSKWFIIHDRATHATTESVGLHWSVTATESPPNDSSVLAVANLRQPTQPAKNLPANLHWKRQLMCHVPVDSDGAPVWFEHLAKQSRGDWLLGVIKADADSVGTTLETLLKSSPTLGPLAVISQQLDEFFAGKLMHELRENSAWQLIYTVFGGGDDLLLVGPWNVIFEFSGRLHNLFQADFKRWGLTISAGLALAKWKRPIKFAASQAEELLEHAKSENAVGESKPKDQIAAFGQIWKWNHHTEIVSKGKQLADWVDRGMMLRGWLHTLLELAELRVGNPTTQKSPDLLATARLKYHVVRNYRDPTVRNWGEQLIADFDSQERIETRYLPAIVRYALTATRKPFEEE